MKNKKQPNSLFSLAAAFLIFWSPIKSQNLDSLLKDARLLKSDTLKAASLNKIAEMYFASMDFERAFSLSKEAYEIYSKAGLKSRQGNSLCNMASILFRMQQVKEAIKYYEQALDIALKSKDKQLESLVYSNLGSLHYETREMDKMLEYSKKALVLQESIGDKKIIAACKILLGNYYQDVSDFALALKEYEDCYVIYSKNSDTISMARIMGDIATVKFDMNRKDEAVITLKKSLTLLKNHKDSWWYSSNNELLYRCYKEIGDYSNALKCLEITFQFTEKKYYSDITLKVMELKEKFDAEKRENDILKLKEQSSYSIVIAEERKVIVVVVCAIAIILFLLLLLFFVVNRYRRKQKEIAFIKTKAELEQTALLAQMNPHFIFNALNSIQYYILNKETEYAYDYLAKFSKLIRQVLINSELNTIALNKEIETLQLYIELEQRRLKNRFDFEINYANNFPAHDITIPTMLIQPFVENAIWHGIMNMPEDKKGKLVLNFSLVGKQLKISVEDNGIGRKEAALRKMNNEYKSVGVMFTQKRLELLKAVSKQQSEIIISDLVDANGKATGTKVEILMEIIA